MLASTRRPAVVLTLGKFDGVHAGHRRLAALLIQAAREAGVQSAALVLHPHPAQVLSGTRIPILASPAERCRRLSNLGVDIVEPLHFTAELAALDPLSFVHRLAARFRILGIIVGPDFVFGRDRQGDAESLRRIGLDQGFFVKQVPALLDESRPFSSGKLRELIEAGSVAVARSHMRVPHMLSGTVVHGAARGRELGFPTANLDLRLDHVVPGNGIYAVRARWDGANGREGGPWIDGVASIGVRPTFDNGPRSIEVFLLDFNADLYGREMQVAFIARQRGEERFENIEALVAQMHADVRLTRRLLAAEQAPAWQVVPGTAGPRAHVRGFDLCALLQNAGRARAALRLGSSAAASPVGAEWEYRPKLPEPSQLPRHVDLVLSESHDQAQVLQAWLDRLGDHHCPWLVRAGLRGVDALLIEAGAGNDGPQPSSRIRVDGPVLREESGWLQARLTL
jgi:riboflavin kinase/FMN adenylyltransferase